MAQASRERKLVVAGLVVGPKGVLITQRRPGGPLGLYWEFPGGKVEGGESPEDALARELEEEIGVRSEVGHIWHVLSHAYPDFDLLMLVYLVRLRPGEVPTRREVEDLAWVGPDTIGEANILPADAPLVARIRSEGVPDFLGRLPASPRGH